MVKPRIPEVAGALRPGRGRESPGHVILSVGESRAPSRPCEVTEHPCQAPNSDREFLLHLDSVAASPNAQGLQFTHSFTASLQTFGELPTYPPPNSPARQPEGAQALILGFTNLGSWKATGYLKPRWSCQAY